MAISDEQVASLRAFLDLKSGEGTRLTEQLIQTDGVEGYGELVYAAFVVAVRRRFHPTWTLPGVVRLVAAVRTRLLDAEIKLDPRAAEILIRRALGDTVGGELDDETKASAQVFVLAELVAAEELGDAELDEFMATARTMADQLIGRVTGS